MADLSHESSNELTSTIHLSALRAVPTTHSPSELLSDEEKSIVAQLSPKSAMLIGVSGPGKGFRFLLDNDVNAIGRDPKNDISLDDVTVSRTHARITARNGVYTIEDLKSLNGSYVNAASVSQSILNNGDEIQIGKFRFNFFQNVSGK